MATLTTSAGPLLLLLTVAAALGRPAYGAALSLAYSIGRGVPFLRLDDTGAPGQHRRNGALAARAVHAGHAEHNAAGTAIIAAGPAAATGSRHAAGRRRCRASDDLPGSEDLTSMNDTPQMVT